MKASRIMVERAARPEVARSLALGRVDGVEDAVEVEDVAEVTEGVRIGVVTEGSEFWGITGLVV